jgi:hypothetical protein
MLYIVMEDARSHAWHVGERWPVRDEEAVHVTMIQADGDELDLILRFFKNLPWRENRRVLRWPGDLARFIAFNMTNIT